MPSFQRMSDSLFLEVLLLLLQTPLMMMTPLIRLRLRHVFYTLLCLIFIYVLYYLLLNFFLDVTENTIWVFKERCYINWTWCYFSWHWLKIRIRGTFALLRKQKYVSNVFSFVISCCSRMEWISYKIDIMYVKEMRLMM